MFSELTWAARQWDAELSSPFFMVLASEYRISGALRYWQVRANGASRKGLAPKSSVVSAQ